MGQIAEPRRRNLTTSSVEHLSSCPTKPAKPIGTMLAHDGDGLLDSEAAAIRAPTDLP